MKLETKIIIAAFSILGWLTVISAGWILYVIAWQENEIGTYSFGDTLKISK